MTNSVMNFSLHLRDDKPFLLLPHWRVAVVPITLNAIDAARIAEGNQLDALIVVDNWRPKGLFFRDHLANILPTHYFVNTHLSPQGPDVAVSEYIRQLDAAGVDFHSERVNINVRLCPRGHVTEGNPCPDHGLTTTEY